MESAGASYITNKKETTSNDDQDLLDIISGLQNQLALMEKFVARRFDEISMEINATSQQVDMAEEGITQRFTDIFQALEALAYQGDGKTAANTGVELDAVLKTTE